MRKKLFEKSRATLIITGIIFMSFISTGAYIILKNHPTIETTTSLANGVKIGLTVVVALALLGWEIYSRVLNKTNNVS